MKISQISKFYRLSGMTQMMSQIIVKVRYLLILLQFSTVNLPLESQILQFSVSVATVQLAFNALSCKLQVATRSREVEAR